MTDKPIKDLTPEEREAFLQELKEKATPEQWESFTQFAQLVTEAATWWNSDDVKAARSAAAETLETLREGAQTAAYIFTGLREFLPVLLEEMEKDGEAATMTARSLKTAKTSSRNTVHVSISSSVQQSSVPMEKSCWVLLRAV